MAIVKKTTIVAKSDDKKKAVGVQAELNSDTKASFKTMEYRGKHKSIKDMFEPIPLAKKEVKKVETPKAKLSTMEYKGKPKTLKESFKTMEIRGVTKKGLTDELKPLNSRLVKDKGFAMKSPKNTDKGFAMKAGKNIDKGFEIKITKKKK
jgi:hypothetical protein